MKLRLTIGAIFVLYAILGFLIQFVPVISAYYVLAVSTYSGNPSLANLFKFFNPFDSVLQSFFWFAYCLGLGFFLILFRKLQTEQKPPWMTRPISNSKSLG